MTAPDRTLASYERTVRALARRYGLPSDPAESLSRAWDGFHKALGTYEPEHASGLSFESWAAWTAKGRLYALRKQAILRATRERVAYETDVRVWAHEAPSNDVHDAFDCERLREAVAALPERQREAVELVYFRGMNQREAADALGVTYPAIQHRLERALRTLRGALADEEAA